MERCDDVLESTGQEIHTVDFIRECMEVHDQALTEDTIKTAWRKSGIFPFNHNIFMAEDFTTSHSTSTKSHLPISYPGYLQEEEIDNESGEDKMQDESSDPESD